MKLIRSQVIRDIILNNMNLDDWTEMLENELEEQRNEALGAYLLAENILHSKSSTKYFDDSVYPHKPIVNEIQGSYVNFTALEVYEATTKWLQEFHKRVENDIYNTIEKRLEQLNKSIFIRLGWKKPYTHKYVSDMYHQFGDNIFNTYYIRWLDLQDELRSKDYLKIEALYFLSKKIKPYKDISVEVNIANLLFKNEGEIYR